MHFASDERGKWRSVEFEWDGFWSNLEVRISLNGSGDIQLGLELGLVETGVIRENVQHFELGPSEFSCECVVIA